MLLPHPLLLQVKSQIENEQSKGDTKLVAALEENRQMLADLQTTQEKVSERGSICVYVCHVHIYIYTYIYI